MTRLGLLLVAACGNSGVDHPIGDGPCGGDLFFTGELVDFDSTENLLCGIFGAPMQVHGDASRSDSTNPNGRFSLCLADAATTRVDISPPATTSECTVPPSTYAAPGIIIASKAVIETGQLISARTFTIARAPDFAYDATKAQVLVHVDGPPRAVEITGSHDPAQAFDSAWAAGDTGANVFLPNVDPSPGTTTINVANAIGTGSVPIAAGTFTYVTVVTN